jgi:hypothetical protein
VRGWSGKSPERLSIRNKDLVYIGDKYGKSGIIKEDGKVILYNVV